jgi:hypothetical protein
MTADNDFPFSHPVYGLSLSDEALLDTDGTFYAVEWGPAESPLPVETLLRLVPSPSPPAPADERDGRGA